MSINFIVSNGLFIGQCRKTNLRNGIKVSMLRNCKIRLILMLRIMFVISLILSLSGTYCPTGSSAPIPCPAGKYCGTDNLDLPTGNCTAGYYCNSSETVSNPVECSFGHYCPEGTPTEIPCSPGTFNSMYS